MNKAEMMDTLEDIRKKTVLVVDDEPVIQQLFQSIFKGPDYEVTVAGDGVQAFEKIQAYDYDMLILDLRLPGLDGMTLVDKVHGAQKDPIIIIITGAADIDTAKEALRKGCFDYIPKPFDIAHIASRIAQAFDARLQETESRKQREYARIKEKLASLAQMSGAAVHEINTVLVSVKHFLSVLKVQLPHGPYEAQISSLMDEIERVERLVFKTLTFSSPDEPEYRMSAINQIIKRSLRLVRYRADKQSVKIAMSLQLGIPDIWCDPFQIEEVFLNLITNSIDAMPFGGTLTIETSLDNDCVVVHVRDTGDGIPPENLSQIFNPFFTTKLKGTGLGLSIVHRIIERHRGFIEATSKIHQGTGFTVKLPREPG